MQRVWCAFVFDTTILQPLSDAWQTRHPDTQPQDRRVEFILAALGELDEALRAKGGGLIVLYGDPVDLVPKLADELSVDAVFTNHDYEPVAIGRDETVHERLVEAGRQWLTFKDQVIFERDEVLTGQNKPFTVFTPYKNAWLKQLTAFDLKPYPVETYTKHLAALPPKLDRQLPTLDQLGFAPSNLAELNLPTGMSGAQRLLDDFMTRIDSYRTGATFPPSKARATCRCICASALSRSARSRDSRTRCHCSRTGKAQPRGCRN